MSRHALTAGAQRSTLWMAFTVLLGLLAALPFAVFASARNRGRLATA